MAKTVYHSFLAKNSPVTLTVMSDVKDSQYPNKPRYVYVLLDGEDEKRPLDLDSEACEKFFEGQNGRKMTICAEGRDADAFFTYVGEPGSQLKAPATKTPARAAAPVTAPPPRQAAPPPAANRPPAKPAIPSSDALLSARRFAAKRIGLMKIATKAMTTFRDEYDAWAEKSKRPKMSEEVFWAKVTSLYISMESEGIAIRAGFADALPMSITFPDLAEVASKKPPGQKPAAAQLPPPTTAKCPRCERELDATGVCPACDDDVPF